MNVRLLEENDHKPPPPGLRWRELMQQQQAAKRHSGEGPSSTSSSPSPSRQLLDKSYESLTRVAVEDFLLRESAVQRWIEECLGTPLRSSQPALYALLADGVVLCQLMSGLDQGSIPRIHTGKMLELGFKRRENIMYFIEALRDNKIPPGFIFHVDDLYQHQNFYRVIESLEYLSELAYREWGAPHRKKSKEDIRKLVEQGEIELTEEAFARTEKVLKDYLAKKKWFLAPGKTTARVGLPAAAVNSKPTNTNTTATTATPTTTPPPPAEAEDSAPRPRSESEGRSENEGKSADDDDDKNRKNEAEAEAIMGKNEDEDEDEDEGSTEDGFTKAVSSNPWREAELEEKRRKIEEAERQRREDEDNQREEEQRRLAEAKRREEAAVLTGAIRLQALYRGRLARTAFRSKLRAAAYRENVANEIFQTEKDYVANLGLLFDTFLHPIKEHMTGSVWHYSLASCLANSNSVASGSGLRKSGETPTLVVTNAHTVELKEFKDLFANIQVIRNFNTKLLDDLHPRLRAWTPHQQLGDIFVQVAMFLKVYTAYVKNYDAMRRELAQAKASSPEFKQYLVECADANRGRVGKQDINSLLIQPVQRIPRYLLLLRELAKHTEPDHKDFANINTALEQIKKVAEYIEQKSADSEKVHKMISIQARFHGECESLIDPGRVFIREAQLLGWNVKNKRKQIYVVFLFNDLLVLARPMKENKNWRRTITISSKAKVAASVAAAAAGGAGHHGAGGDAAHSQHQHHHQHHQQDLVFSRSFQLRHLVPTALPDTKRGHCFGLVAEFDQAVAKFYTTDPSERDEWLAELHAVKKAIVKNNKARKDVIRRTLRARKNKSVKGLSSMAKAFEADDQQLAGLGIGDDGPGARQHESSAGSQLVLSPRSDPRAGEKPKQQTRREKTMSVMLTPSPPLHHHNHFAGGRAGESSARRESLWEPAVLPTHSSASALPPTGGTSSPSSSSHSVGTAALPRSSSAGTGEPLATVVVGKKGGAAKLRTASSDVIVDDSGSHHHHLKVSNGSRIRKSSKAAARSPLPPPLEEKDSEEWEEVGGGRTGLTDSDSDDDDDHERDADVTTPCDEDEAVPHRRQRASARGGDKTEKTATSLRVVAGGDVAEEEQGDLYGSGGHKPATATTSGRTRGHVRSRSATFRQRLQLSPRKAFEAISSAKKKAKESGGE